MLSPNNIVIEHVLDVCVMALVAGPVVVYGVGEKRVETETNQVRLAHLIHVRLTSELE